MVWALEGVSVNLVVLGGIIEGMHCCHRNMPLSARLGGKTYWKRMPLVGETAKLGEKQTVICINERQLDSTVIITIFQEPVVRGHWHVARNHVSWHLVSSPGKYTKQRLKAYKLLASPCALLPGMFKGAIRDTFCRGKHLLTRRSNTISDSTYSHFVKALLCCSKPRFECFLCRVFFFLSTSFLSLHFIFPHTVNLSEVGKSEAHLDRLDGCVKATEIKATKRSCSRSCPAEYHFCLR